MSVSLIPISPLLQIVLTCTHGTRSSKALGEQGLQERICYNYPLGNDASILCLQSADQSQYGNQTPGVATFFGSVWELKNGNLIRRSDEASIPVTFDYTAASAASLAMPNNTFMTMFTDGVSVQDTSGGTGVFVPILAAAQANPPGDLTQACRALVKQTCPGTQGHGDDCSSSLAAAAAAFAALHCPDPKVKSNYDWYCAAGKARKKQLLKPPSVWSFCLVLRFGPSVWYLFFRNPSFYGRLRRTTLC